MIEARFTRENDRIKSFLITGHAESGPYGHDLVCAAVSALAIGVANSLGQLVESEPDIILDEKNGGYLKVSVKVSNTIEKSDNTQLLLEHLLLSLKSIQDEYGEYIIVIE